MKSQRVDWLWLFALLLWVVVFMMTGCDDKREDSGLDLLDTPNVGANLAHATGRATLDTTGWQPEDELERLGLIEVTERLIKSELRLTFISWYHDKWAEGEKAYLRSLQEILLLRTLVGKDHSNHVWQTARAAVLLEIHNEAKRVVLLQHEAALVSDMHFIWLARK